MAKFQGVIGFVQTMETSPGSGIWNDVVTEKPCKGDILRNSHQWESGEYLNKNININNRFSILADTYFSANLPYIRFIEWNGTKWNVESIDIQRPRLILHVRGVYNG